MTAQSTPDLSSGIHQTGIMRAAEGIFRVSSADRTCSYTGSGYADGGVWIKDGQGTLAWHNGEKYEGEWKADNRSGQGVHTTPDGTKYDGQWRDDKKNGHGILTLANGSRFEGEFKDDKLDGQGRYTTTNGTVLEGQWREGRTWNAQGIDIWPDGTRYEGVWSRSGDTSRGEIRWKDGRKYEGEWKIVEGQQDLPNGQGTLSWPDGRKYVGAFKDGKRHGVGKMTYTDRKIEEGNWEEDKFAGSLAKAVERPELGSPAIKTGTVMVTGDDTTFEVFTDGFFVGNVPAKLRLSEGGHVIEVKKEGFRPYSKEIKVTEGCELNLRPVLEPN